MEEFFKENQGKMSAKYIMDTSHYCIKECVPEFKEANLTNAERACTNKCIKKQLELYKKITTEWK